MVFGYFKRYSWKPWEFKKYEEFLHYRYIEEKLIEAEAQANDPNTKWLKHDEVWKKLCKKYEL